MTDNEKLLMTALSAGLKVTHSLMENNGKFTPEVVRELNYFLEKAQIAIDAVTKPK